jgi:hypothetical protein
VSGPPYPRGTGIAPIGQFVIGVSPIGQVPSFDIWLTVISQFANSPRLMQLILDFFGYIDQTVNFENFIDDIWDIDTATGYGLDVWGRIVGVTRVLSIPTPSTFLGFKEASPGSDAFNSSPFFQGQSATNNFVLSDDAFRILIFAKALANISDGSVKAINQLLLSLFPGRGNAFVTDNQDMTMTYTFLFALSLAEQAIVGQSGVLPKPTGVSASFMF